VCFEFMEEFKKEPSDYDMLFDFLRYKKTKNILQQRLEEHAKALRGAT